MFLSARPGYHHNPFSNSHARMRRKRGVNQAGHRGQLVPVSQRRTIVINRAHDAPDPFCILTREKWRRMILLYLTIQSAHEQFLFVSRELVFERAIVLYTKGRQKNSASILCCNLIGWAVVHYQTLMCSGWRFSIKWRCFLVFQKFHSTYARKNRFTYWKIVKLTESKFLLAWMCLVVFNFPKSRS